MWTYRYLSRKSTGFFIVVFKQITFPTFREIWHTIPRTGPGYKRSQRLFLKRSLRHVENICIAQHGLKSEPEASISPPQKFFKANRLKCGPDNAQSVFILHTQQLDTDRPPHARGWEMEQMSNSGLLWQAFIPLTCFPNSIWREPKNRLYQFVLLASDSVYW